MKWLVDTLGFEELQRRIFKVRHFLLASSTWPGGIPAEVEKAGDAPAGRAADVEATPIGQGTPVTLRRRRRLRALGGRQRRPRRRQGHRVGLSPTPTSATSPPPSSAAWPRSSASSAPRCASPTARTSCSAASPSASCRRSSTASTPSAWPTPGAELVRDVVACPGADTCNLAVTQSRGLADAIGHRPRGRRPGRGRRAAHQHLRAAPTPAASTTSPTSASSAPSAGPTASPLPATRCCSAATSARRRSTSARRPCACRPRTRPRPWCGSCAGSPTSARRARRSGAGSTAPAAPRRSARR